MKSYRQCLAAFAFAGVFLWAAAREKGTHNGYVGAIVIEADSGQVLFEDNADAVSPPASMTKLMTFAVLHDKLTAGDISLQTAVKVSHEDAKIGMRPDSTSVWLKENEEFPVEELIYAMMIQSANDAAYCIAHNVAGSTEAFVELMNAKARALGMAHTAFRSPHGLPPPDRRVADGDLTTPRDFATLCRYLINETDVLKYTSVRTRPFGANRPSGAVVMTNHNHLLGHVAGLDGLKTGYTAGAGFCLSATAERNGRRIIAVVMGGSERVARDVATKELIERGFASLPPPTKLSTVKAAADGPRKTVPLAAESTQSATAAADPIPTVKVDRSAENVPQPATTNDLSLTFQVTPAK